MNQIAIFFAVIAVAAAATLPGQTIDATAETLRSESAVNPDSFQYAYETSNGIKANEAGQLKQIGQESGIVSQGEYSYTAPDGQQIRVTYIADENGFQPQGDHLPVAPNAGDVPVLASPVRVQPVRFDQARFQGRLNQNQ